MEGWDVRVVAVAVLAADVLLLKANRQLQLLLNWPCLHPPPAAFPHPHPAPPTLPHPPTKAASVAPLLLVAALPQHHRLHRIPREVHLAGPAVAEHHLVQGQGDVAGELGAARRIQGANGKPLAPLLHKDGVGPGLGLLPQGGLQGAEALLVWGAGAVMGVAKRGRQPL